MSTKETVKEAFDRLRIAMMEADFSSLVDTDEFKDELDELETAILTLPEPEPMASPLDRPAPASQHGIAAVEMPGANAPSRDRA